MTQVIVCTSINPPTEAVLKFDSMTDWTLIVVGDQKTPKDYALERGYYISPHEQASRYPDLSEAIGWNCIQRRNLGFLIARELGATVVATVDDDNIPLDGWGQDVVVGRPTRAIEFRNSSIAFDPIGATNYPHLWHRGFPLQLIAERNYRDFETVEINPAIQADFWNGDPDIDAICRLEHRPECDFDDGAFPFSSNRVGPFNSQNTFISASLIPDYFLFPHVGRMDDIWASYYVQALGHRVIYRAPSVYQKRNEHDLIVDMRNEYLGYENNLQLIQDILVEPSRIRDYLPERSQVAWDNYRMACE
jgi:hypothetical protein